LFFPSFASLWYSSRLFLFVFFLLFISLRQQGKKKQNHSPFLCSPAGRCRLRHKKVYLLACGAMVCLVADAIASIRSRTSCFHPGTFAQLAAASPAQAGRVWMMLDYL
jgi:hypothetical protein